MGPRKNPRKNTTQEVELEDGGRGQSDSSLQSPPRNNLSVPLVHTPLGSHPSSSLHSPVINPNLPGSHAQDVLVGRANEPNPPRQRQPHNLVDNQVATQMAQVIQQQMGAFFDRFLQHQQEALTAVQQARDQQQQRLIQGFQQGQEQERQASLERHNNLIQAIDKQQANYLSSRPPTGGQAPVNGGRSNSQPLGNLERTRSFARSEDNLIEFLEGGVRNGTRHGSNNPLLRPANHPSVDINLLPGDNNSRMLLNAAGGGGGSVHSIPAVSGLAQFQTGSSEVISHGPSVNSQNNNGHHHSNHHLKTTEVPKYTGAADSKTPFDFILELEKYRDISRGSEIFILREILPIALVGTAYHWFRHEITMAPFVNWEDFKIRFRREFQALGYSEELNRELELRTQGPTEPLTLFIRVILDYYERLGRESSEGEKVARIMRQMHPEYLQVLQGKTINNIKELKEAAFQAQDIIKAYRISTTTNYSQC